MKTYTANQVVLLESEQMEQVQKSIDKEAEVYLEEKKEELSFLDSGCDNIDNYNRLKEYFVDTMEKYRLIYESLVCGFKTSHNTGFPEAILSIDLSDGSIETDKNGRPVNYSTEILAPCTTAMLHYVNREANNVYVIIPPIKSVDRTVEKIISECVRERDEYRDENMKKFGIDNFEDEPELPFGICETAKNIGQDLLDHNNDKNVCGVLTDIAKKDVLPRDIYRMTITSRYPSDLEFLIKELSEKFPSYIEFEKGERNSYKKNLSENERNYFDIKKTARIKIPNSNRYFYIEFQFKQTNMFFAHIRSHKAYEEYRVLYAKYAELKDKEEKKSKPNVANKAKLMKLKKQCEDKKQICLTIHKNAVHQSNMYIINKIMWMDNNARGLRRVPEYENGCYKDSVDTLLKNYILESYEPFDGATAFSLTGDAKTEHFNQAYYLKALGILPESFDEMGKNSKEAIAKSWSNLTQADLRDFQRITATAIKYQDVIRKIQKERKMLDSSVILNALAENQR